MSKKNLICYPKKFKTLNNNKHTKFERLILEIFIYVHTELC